MKNRLGKWGCLTCLSYILLIYLRKKFVSSPISKLIRHKTHLFQDAFNKFVSPKDVMNFEEGEIASRAQIDNPVFDYVPPELVTLYVSNM